MPIRYALLWITSVSINPVRYIKPIHRRGARRILNKLELHYTAKHACCLNMAEIEIGVMMSRQCLDRRIPDMEMLKEELSAWEQKRNEQKETINWMFDVDAARSKLNKANGKLR